MGLNAVIKVLGINCQARQILFVDVITQDVTDNALEDVDEIRIEDAALIGANHLHGCFVAESLLVAALLSKGVVHVSKTYYLRAYALLVTLETFWIATAIIALMVVQTDVIGIFEDVRGLNANLADELGTANGVSLDDIKFLRGKSAWLVENGIRDGDLAYVMEN